MAVNILCYPPGGGGNHLKNLCELGDVFLDQWPWPWVREQRVGILPYYDPPGMPGEVHSLPGRNMHEVFIDHIEQHPRGHYLLHGHFGELAPYADRIRGWTDVRWLLVTIDHAQDRELLRQRQRRLDYHPYWLDEEQIFIYRPDMCVHYFGARSDHVFELALREIWARDIQHSAVLPALQRAFGVEIDGAAAQALHDRWCDLNFGPDRS